MQRFVYTSEMLQQSRPVSLAVRNATLAEVLNLVFENQPLQFSVDDRFIKVSFKPAVQAAVSGFGIQGRVLTESGEALGNATVSIKNKNTATLTDAEGRFSLRNLEATDVLVVSNVGYASTEVRVNTGNGLLTVRLSLSVTPLDETVVIAYGTTTNRLNTGNVTKVGGEAISRQPLANPLAALEGQVAGLSVNQTSGLPGAAVRVQLRGRTALDLTLTDDQPLFVIDGVPYAPNNAYLNTLRSALGLPGNSPALVTAGGLSPFNSVIPSDIESIEILKDADATAIYGSRGANGVVIITTKKGRSGKTSLGATFQSGLSKTSRSVNLLPLAEYRKMRREAFANDGITPTTANAYDLLVWDSTRYTDFRKLLTGGTAHTSDAQVAVNGGSSLTQFSVSGNFHSESTVFPGNLSNQRGGMHLTLNHALPNQKLRLQFSGSYTGDKNNLVVSDLTSQILLPPNFKVYDSAGGLAWNEGNLASNFDNPLAYLLQKYVAKTDNLIGNLLVGCKITNALTVRVSAGYNSVLLNETQQYPLSSQNPLASPLRSASFATNFFKSWIAEPQAEYTKNIARGKLTLLVGGTYQHQTNEATSLSGSGYVSDELLNSVSGATSISGSRKLTEYKYSAVFGRIHYDWLSQYVLNLSARRDGSSRFGPGRQFSNFGSVGAAWIFSNGKNFERHFSFLSFGKLRGSYGITGNDKIPNYQYLDTWDPTFNSYQNSPGLAPSKLFNPDYRWEQTTKLEGALDLGMLKDKILLSAVYYQNRSSNQLVQYKLPTTTGFANVIQNLAATVQNTGWEFTLTSTNINSGAFRWRSAANLTVPKTRLLSFPDLKNSSYASQYVIGEPLNLIYKYRFLGVDSGSGVYKIEDLNKDGVLNTNDYQVAGNADPRFYGGLQNSFTYKGLQADIFFQFVKQTGTNYWNAIGNPPGLLYNLPTAVLQHWQRPGDDAIIQRYTQSTAQAAYSAYSNFRQSDGIYSDASFVRLKTLSVSYSLPSNWLRSAKLSSVRVYVTGQNLLTFTGYKGGDPEIKNFLRLPTLRTFVGGFQFNL